MAFFSIGRATRGSRHTWVMTTATQKPIATIACRRGKCRIAITADRRLKTVERDILSLFVNGQEHCRTRATIQKQLKRGSGKFTRGELALMTQKQRAQVAGHWSPLYGQ